MRPIGIIAMKLWWHIVIISLHNCIICDTIVITDDKYEYHGVITMAKEKKISAAQKNLIDSMSREETKKEKIERLKKAKLAEQKEAEDIKKSPYRNFLQVNQDNYKAEDWLMRESPPAYRLLRFIAQNMDNYNALICSYKVFQETLGYGRATIARAVKMLKDNHFIQVAKSGTANIYLINKELYWHSYGYNYSQAEFGAKIIISSEEQEEELKADIKAKRYKAVEIEEEQNVGA